MSIAILSVIVLVLSIVYNTKEVMSTIAHQKETKLCSGCPLNAVCEDEKIVNCNEGFSLFENELCVAEQANPTELALVSHLIKVNTGIRAGQDFNNFGSKESDVITGQEILEFGLNMGGNKENEEEAESQAIEALSSVLQSISPLGINRFCLKDHFSNELMDYSSEFNQPSDVKLTSLRLGSPQTRHPEKEADS